MGFQMGDEISEEVLKKKYIEKAKEMHPDRDGSNEQFTILQEAYSRLKAEMEGYNLSEEDIQEMYR